MTANKPVVVDTNTWLSLERDKRDVLSLLTEAGYEPVLLSAVADELERLAAGASADAVASRVALAVLKRKGLKTVSCSPGPADDAILSYCRDTGAAAATYDAGLKARLRAAGVRVVTPTRRLTED